MSGTGGYGGRDDERRRDLDQAMYVGLARTRRQMLGEHGDGLLDKVEGERLLVTETTKASARAVAEARAEPGHRGDCERQTIAVCANEAGLEAYGQPAGDIRQTVPSDGRKSPPPPEAIEPEGTGWGCDARTRRHGRGARRHRLSETEAAHESS